RALVAQTLIDFGDPRSRHWQLMRRETMPPQAMLARRREAPGLGVLGQLEATANWHRIAREWLFGDPPSTELGALEAPFHTRAAACGERARGGARAISRVGASAGRLLVARDRACHGALVGVATCFRPKRVRHRALL